MFSYTLGRGIINPLHISLYLKICELLASTHVDRQHVIIITHIHMFIIGNIAVDRFSEGLNL